MKELGIVLGLLSFLLLAAVGEKISLAFATGVAVLIVSSACLSKKSGRRARGK